MWRDVELLGSDSVSHPSISVIIPAYNAAPYLRVSLNHLAQSSMPYLECIVADDGSTDETAEVAKSAGVNVISVGGPSGPAHARNAAARIAKGDILFFLDADVCVHPDTISRVLDAFEADPALDALIGSYDDSPGSEDFISQYKNLMHCFVHQHARREACTFWSGCGAIRRDLFLEHAGFDESYGRPAIEDIELGYRLHMAKRHVILDKNVVVKHLKRWTFWGLLKSDILDRGIPWTELILRDRSMPNDLNIELSQRVSVALAFLLIGFAGVAAAYWRGHFLTPLFAVVLFLLARYFVGPESHSKSTLIFLSAAIAGLVCLAWTHRMKGIVPPVLLGYLLLFLRHRYAYSNEKARRWTGFLLGVYTFSALVYMVSHLPSHMLVFAVFLIAVAIVFVNTNFYLFLAAKQGRVFALAAVPFHLLYHVYNGISFTVGLTHYVWTHLTVRVKHVFCSDPKHQQGLTAKQRD